MTLRSRILSTVALLCWALPAQTSTEVHRSFRANGFGICQDLPAACFDPDQRAWTLLREQVANGFELVLRSAKRERSRLPSDRGALLTADGVTLTVLWQQRQADQVSILARTYSTEERDWLGPTQTVASAPWLHLYGAQQVDAEHRAIVYGVSENATAARRPTVLLQIGKPKEAWRPPIAVVADTELRQVALAGDRQHLAIAHSNVHGQLFVDTMPLDGDRLTSNVGVAVGGATALALRDDRRFAMSVSEGWVTVALFERDADHEITLVRTLASDLTFGSRRYDCIATHPPLMLPQPAGAAIVLLPEPNALDFLVDGTGHAPRLGTMAKLTERIEAASLANEVGGSGALVMITSDRGETPWRASVTAIAAKTLTHQFEPVYSLRTLAGRRATIRNRAYEQAIDNALLWLQRYQDADGRWDCDKFMKHDDPAHYRCDGPGNAVHDIGVTGLATLALLSEGRNPLHEPATDRALQWLIQQQRNDGLFGRGVSDKFIYDHAIATTAIAEASAIYLRADYRRAAQAAIDYLERHRNPYSVWRYKPRDNDNDLSVTAWCVQAYHAAGMAGLTVKPRAMKLAATWLDQVSDPTGNHGYTKQGERSYRLPGDHRVRWPKDRSESLTAMGLYCRFLLGQDPKERIVMKAAADRIVARPITWDEKAGAIDHYYWYYGCQAIPHMGKSHTRNWNKRIEAQLIKKQHRDGQEPNLLGSWDPVGPWGEQGGRVYSTAILCLALQAPYRMQLSPR